MEDEINELENAVLALSGALDRLERVLAELPRPSRQIAQQEETNLETGQEARSD